jgi:hypothetical protein
MQLEVCVLVSDNTSLLSPCNCYRKAEEVSVVTGSVTSVNINHEIPYILESNPHPFYSFRGLKKSDVDYNRMQIRFAVKSWILEK